MAEIIAAATETDLSQTVQPETLPEPSATSLHAPIGRMILIGEGAIPIAGIVPKPEDPTTMAMTGASRQRVRAAGRWYQQHTPAFEAPGAQIVVGGGTAGVFDWPGKNDEHNSGILAHYLKTHYLKLAKPPIVEVQTGSTPFGAFKDMVDQGLFVDAEFTSDEPLVLSAGRLYGNSVLAQIARAVFDIKERDGVKVLPGEIVTRHRWKQGHRAAMLTYGVLRVTEIVPHDPSSLARADQFYERIMLARRAAFGTRQP